MRRTLTVAALAAAMLVPASAASADPGSNASCSNGKGGNSHGEYNGLGNAGKAQSCLPTFGDGGASPVDVPVVPVVPEVVEVS